MHGVNVARIMKLRFVASCWTKEDKMTEEKKIESNQVVGADKIGFPEDGALEVDAYSTESDFDEDEEFDEDQYLYDADQDGVIQDEDEEYEDYVEDVDFGQQASDLANSIATGGFLTQISSLLGGGISPAEIAFVKGRTFQTSNDLEKAAEAYLDAITKDSGHLRAYVALGQVLLALGKPGESIPFLKKASEIDPYDAGSYFFLGYAYFALQNFEKCVEYFGKVVELEPMHHLAYNNLGFSHYLVGELELAGKAFTKAGDVGSDRAYYNLGMIKLLLGKEKEAWQAYEDAAEMDPNGNQISEHLADLKTAQARFPESKSLLIIGERKMKERAKILGIS